MRQQSRDHQRSCIACVNGKRRCDRKFPQCSRCVNRGWQCIYTNGVNYSPNTDDLPFQTVEHSASLFLEPEASLQSLPFAPMPPVSIASPGCVTSKIRRVKSDETNTVCKCCANTRRKCDRYNILRFRFNPVTYHDLPMTQGMLVSIPGSADEKRSFSYYVTHTRQALSGYYESLFWGQFIVQAAMTCPVLRHGIIAIGALHEAFSCEQIDWSQKSIEKSFAMVQYTKALRLLQLSLADNTKDTRLVLVSCILFASFESMRGAHAPALIHLKSGLNIMRHMKMKCAQDLDIYNDLAPALASLAIQAILYLKSAPVCEQKALGLEIERFSKPGVEVVAFTTLEEARITFSRIMCSLVYIILTLDFQLPYSAQRGLISAHTWCIEQLFLWSDAFRRYTHQNHTTLSDQDLRGSTLLKIQHTTARIMAHVIYSTLDDSQPLSHGLCEQERFKPFRDDFRLQTRLAASLIAASKEYYSNGQPKFSSNFSADWGIIWPLHYCCIKSPDNDVRAAALDLLRQCHRREGMWDSNAVVDLIQTASLVMPRDQGKQQRHTQEGGETLPLSTLPKLRVHNNVACEWIWMEEREGATSWRSGGFQSSSEDSILNLFTFGKYKDGHSVVYSGGDGHAELWNGNMINDNQPRKPDPEYYKRSLCG